MKICLIGGIYGAPQGYLQVTPETTLEAGLRARGHQVTTLSHYAAARFGEFDVVHVHHLSWGALRLACDPSAAPFVFTLHDASRMNGVSQGWVRERSLDWILSRVDHLVALSAAEAGHYARTAGFEPENVTVIPNGIDAARFAFAPREANPAAERPWRLLFVAQLIPLKGCDLLIRALACLQHRCTLTLAYQTAEMEAQLRALAAAEGVADRVVFAGRQDRAALARLYHESDLLVLPSETESLPSVISEAMLCGLPFAASRVGGIPDQAAGFGQLFHERTPGALASAIDNVLVNYAEHAAKADAMSRSARERFSTEAMVEAHEGVYRRIAGRRPRRAAWRAAPMNAAVRALLAARLAEGGVPS